MCYLSPERPKNISKIKKWSQKQPKNHFLFLERDNAQSVHLAVVHPYELFIEHSSMKVVLTSDQRAEDLSTPIAFRRFPVVVPLITSMSDEVEDCLARRRVESE